MSETWNQATKMVHGGIRRSQYNEVSEAIFLTQGYHHIGLLCGQDR